MYKSLRIFFYCGLHCCTACCIQQIGKQVEFRSMTVQSRETRQLSQTCNSLNSLTACKSSNTSNMSKAHVTRDSRKLQKNTKIPCRSKFKVIGWNTNEYSAIPSFTELLRCLFHVCMLRYGRRSPTSFVVSVRRA